jgi:hypothetical protein
MTDDTAAAAAPVLSISLHQIADGGWEATCARCLSRSGPVLVPSREIAWGELAIQGWTVFRWLPRAAGYAVCPTCSETIGDRVRNARKGRRR